MDSSIYEGLQIMVLGMGTVVVFLLIMVAVMGIVAKAVAVFNQCFPEKVEEVVSNAQVQQSGNNEMIAIAVAMASSKKK